MQFLTRMPPIIRRMLTPAEMGRAVGYYPLVGLVMATVLAGADRILNWLFPPLVSAALLLALWVSLSGGLHMDGFLDACDGLLGGSTPESRMAIMRDERIGAFAFTAGVLLLLIKFAALASLTTWHIQALILAPVLGRWAMSLAVVAFPYARPQGLGRDMKDHATWREGLLATVISVVTAWFSAGTRGLVVIVLATLAMLGIVRFTLKRIPGLTGDVYGVLNEIIEVVVLLTFCPLHL